MFNENERLILENTSVLALRGIVLFPKTVLHFDVSRSRSIDALKAALKKNKEIFVVTQKNIEDKNPDVHALNAVGVMATIRQLVRVPGSNVMRVAVEGFSRARIADVVSEEKFLLCNIEVISPLVDNGYSGKYELAVIREAKTAFAEYADYQNKLSRDIAMKVMSMAGSGGLADFICANIHLDFEVKQEILDEINPVDRLVKLCTILKNETELLKLESSIQERVNKNVDTNQREYYLKEQMRAINEELNGDDSAANEVEEYKNKIKSFEFAPDIEKKLVKEAEKLLKMGYGSQDAYVIRNYLDTVLELPWNTYSTDNLNITDARKVLDDDHFGMTKVKERIIELIAARHFNPDIKGQIICLAGPPGVGKTSIAKSLAKALGRKYVRIALGGVCDEAEIRGHRKTYIGAMNGRIISAIREAKTSNPLMLLDEIDKLGKDYKGDPSAALLEVLDSEQNNSFKDHYIEIPYDLSKVLFITTANDVSNIPEPLYDRMEIIDVPGYTALEKFHIAKKYLVKKQLSKYGLTKSQIKITDAAIRKLISSYTAEAGVRALEREIGTLIRKGALKLVEDNVNSVSFTGYNLSEYLGKGRYKAEKILPCDSVGVVNGLAWTSVGGTLLQVEASVFDGTGKIILTGSLGDVMKESANAAVSYIRSVAPMYGFEKDFYKNKDIHLHFPAGATPKDGPSAGVTIATALLSVLTGIPVKRKVAMTGEISLKGRVLPIGGLKEKAMGAYVAGADTVIIPKDNEVDLEEVNDEVHEKLKFITAENLTDVFEAALCEQPKVYKYRSDDMCSHIYVNGSTNNSAEVIGG